MNTIARKFPTVARLGLGLVFAVMGLNKLIPFLPQPPVSGPPAQFFGALIATGYMLPLLAITEVASGVMLLSGRFVPLALTLLAPVLVNIVGFHFFLAQGGFALPLMLLGLEVYLAWAHRDAFAPMLRMRSLPNTTRIGTADRKALAVAEAR
ncbi:DoxX family protein [Labilithrix luteola]|nr:DoxX family protein [Labilithrix luteola]